MRIRPCFDVVVTRGLSAPAVGTLDGAKLLRLVIPLVAALAGAHQAAAADDSYIRDMPTPERVLVDIHGSDVDDTLARQWGAFYQLKDMITQRSNGRAFTGKLTAAEQQLQKAYLDAMQRLDQPKFG